MSAEQIASAAPAPAVAGPSRTEATPSAHPTANATGEAIPATQKTWRVTRKGKPEDVLKLSDAPVPAKLKKGDVLIKVQAAALNPVGPKLMANLPGFVLRRWISTEFDFAGIVVDANGTEFKEGDEVFGWHPISQAITTGQGALAQYTRSPATNVILRPKNVTPTEASGLPIVALTAYEGLFDIAKLEAGQSVFINGGSTAVGSFAIQLAKAKGAHVAASASAKNEQYVRGLGADEFFDYTKAPLHEQLVAANVTPKYHVFYDTVGIVDPALFVHSPAYLAPQGIFLSVGPQQGPGLLSFAWNVLLRPTFLGGVNRKWKMIQVKPVPEDLKEIAKLVEEGKIRPLMDSVYAFEDALKAYERILTNRATGKVIVKVDPTVA